jgi:hypothetical protein
MDGNSFRDLVPEPQHKRSSRRTFSDMSEQFVENIDHIVENPSISHLNKVNRLGRLSMIIESRVSS